jgi:hypothetical protein
MHVLSIVAAPAGAGDGDGDAAGFLGRVTVLEAAGTGDGERAGEGDGDRGDGLGVAAVFCEGYGGWRRQSMIAQYLGSRDCELCCCWKVRCLSDVCLATLLSFCWGEGGGGHGALRISEEHWSEKGLEIITDQGIFDRLQHLRALGM